MESVVVIELPPQQRYQHLQEGGSVTVPPAGIGEFQVRAQPTGSPSGTTHIRGNRADHRDHDLRLEFHDGLAQTKLPVHARFFSLVRGQAINGRSTEIDEIAAQGVKRIAEVHSMDIGKRAHKGVPNRTVESRVSLIEEPARCRWRFTDK